MHGSVIPPRHVAVIMDGNGRWARTRGKERLEGHRAGAESVRRIIQGCLDNNIRYLTLFSFSTENWRRARTEVLGLMSLFAEKLREEITEKYMQKNGVRLRSIGDVARLPIAVRKLLREVETRTAENDRIDVFLALSYGSRDEIIRAARSLAADVKSGKLKPSDITEESFSEQLWTAGVPDPDLLVRTGGEYRLSNFLLWQLAYSELVIIPEYWPDFDEASLSRCLEEYHGRERRYGMTSDQIKASDAERSDEKEAGSKAESEEEDEQCFARG